MNSFLAKRMNCIKPSPSMAAKKKVDLLRLKGHQIVDFTIGEPDLNTPEHIKKAAIAAIEKDYTRYTSSSGRKELLQAIQQKYQTENNLHFELSNLIVGTGAKQLIFLALMASINEGDEVIIPSPFWVSYPDMVVLNGGIPVIVETSEKNSFKITSQDLENKITSKTKWLLLNTPNNPSGAVYDREEISALLNVLKKYPHVFLMVDEIYEHFLFGKKYISPLSVCPELRDRILLINGVSKTYAMTGWRIGYAAGPEALINAISILISQTTSCASEVSQWAAISALSGQQDCVNEARKIYEERRNIIVNELNNIQGISCLMPEGSFYVFPNITKILGKKTREGKVINTDLDFVHYLLDHVGVAVLDGTAYGMPGYIRMSFATDVSNIYDGCNRIRNACEALI